MNGRLRRAGRRRAAALALLLAGSGCSTASTSAPNAAPTAALPAKCPPIGEWIGARVSVESWRPPQPVPAHARERVLDQVEAYLRECGPQEIVALTQALVAFPTVSAKEPTTGPAFSNMASFLDRWSADAGLTFARHGDNHVWEISLGEGAPHVGFVMHADVVPEGDAAPGALPNGWTHPPFDATLVSTGDELRLYGRGTEDDKGPIAAVLVMLKALREVGLQPQGRAVAILGTGEEHDWEGMHAYATSQPQPAFALSVDASFPVVMAQSGFCSWWLELAEPAMGAEQAELPRITHIEGGEFLTQVPGTARVRIAGSDVEALHARAQRAAEAELAQRGGANEFTLSVTRAGAEITITATGEAVHSSTAEEGANALWPLARVVSALEVAPTAAALMLRLVDRYLADDHHGERLHLAYEHPVMGKLLVAPTVLRQENGVVTLGINLRRPAGLSKEEFAARLNGALDMLRTEIHADLALDREPYIGEPHLLNPESPLVGTLLGVYREHTGDGAAKPTAIRGGTYARLFTNGADFGPSFPGEPYRGHAPDEYITVSALQRTALMLFAAWRRLDALPANAEVAAHP